MGMLLTELFESVHHGGSMPCYQPLTSMIVLVQMHFFAPFSRPLADKQMNILFMPTGDVGGQDSTANLIEVSSFLLRKANFWIKDACNDE
jgi:hypothetical protein